MALDSQTRRLVAKFGTSLLTAGTDRLNLQVMAGLVSQIAALRRGGWQVCVVTSGAVAAGRHRLNASKSRKDMPFRQVLAAVGQSHLMESWEQLFHWHDIVIAQTLLTRRDLADRNGYLNARNVLLALLELGAVPVVNENDTVAVDEIEGVRFGDNDNLSALVANLIDADLLVILTDVDGLHEGDPRKDPSARRIAVVDRIDGEIERAAGEAGSAHGTGGMATKLQAARLATSSGVQVVIADGHAHDILLKVAAGGDHGTRFLAAADRVESRKRWLLSSVPARAGVTVDEGAVRAILKEGKSLLAAGIRGVEGRFSRGDAVAIMDCDGRRFACGITNYGAADLGRIAGVKSDRIAEILGYEFGSEVIHRNNLVLLSE